MKYDTFGNSTKFGSVEAKLIYERVVKDDEEIGKWMVQRAFCAKVSLGYVDNRKSLKGL